MEYVTKIKTSQLLLFTLVSIIIIFLSNWLVLIYTPRTVRDVILLSLIISPCLLIGLKFLYYFLFLFCRDIIGKKERPLDKNGEKIKLEPYVINIAMVGFITSFNYANALLFTDKIIPLLCVIFISFFSIYGCLTVIEKYVGESPSEINLN